MISESSSQELIALRQRVAEQAELLTQAEQQLLHLKQAEQSLRASDHKLALFMQHLPIAVIEWSTTCTVVGWNPAAEQLFGYSAQEAIGDPMAELLLPEYGNQIIARWLHQTEGDRLPLETLNKDGSSITCIWHSVPLTDAQHQVVGVVSMVQSYPESTR